MWSFSEILDIKLIDSEAMRVVVIEATLGPDQSERSKNFLDQSESRI